MEAIGNDKYNFVMRVEDGEWIFFTAGERITKKQKKEILLCSGSIINVTVGILTWEKAFGLMGVLMNGASIRIVYSYSIQSVDPCHISFEYLPVYISRGWRYIKRWIP